MDRVSISESRQARTVGKAVRGPLGIAVTALLALLAFAPGASAFKVISEAGEGAGQTQNPNGIAVDFETGRLFVADADNNRVDVFDSAGSFLKAFGWGVKTGKAEFEVCTASCKKGLPGTGKGQFNQPKSIAVDNDSASPFHHYVYVADTNNNRIEKFDPEGSFALSFGGGVNETKVTEGAPKAERDVCPVAPGDVCGKGSSGFGEGEFSPGGLRGFLVGVGPGGTVYVVDSLESGSERKYWLQKFEPSGALFPPQHLLREGKTAWGLAVDSSGDFYVSNGASSISKYEADGTAVDELQATAYALAVDAEDNLFDASAGAGAEVSIIEFDSAGAPLRRFGYGSFFEAASGLAPYHSSSGDIYTSESGDEFGQGHRVQHLDFPPPGPLAFPQACKANPLGNTKATLNAEVNPEGKASTYHFQYISEEDFEANLPGEDGSFSGPNPATSTAESESIGSDFTLHKASAEASLAPETEYRCRVVATNANGTTSGPEGTFTSLEPLEIGSTWASEVGTEEATLNTEVNPLEVPTTGFFEYVDEATFQVSGFDEAQKTPEIEFGAGKGFKAGAATITGLDPGTSYRYRILATNDFFQAEEKAGVPGPTKALRTFSPGEGGLPDDRAYELVSTGQRNSAEVAVPPVAGGLFLEEKSIRINAAATSGEAVTYTSWTAFGEPKGAPSSSQYLSKRTPSGWGTENISPPGFMKNPLEVPYRGFTPDLRFGGFFISEPALTPEAQEGFQNLYLRDNETGAVQALTIEAPQVEAGEGYCTGYAGASADGQRAFFAAKGAMAGAPKGKGFSLYEWSGMGGGSELNLVSVLPDGSPAPPIDTPENPGLGTGFGGVGGNCTMGQGPVYHAISEDGSVVIWSYAGEYKGSAKVAAKKPLFARIGGTETIQLDAEPAVKPGAGPFGGGRFWAASPDGSKVIFTAPGKLTATAKAKEQLYSYDTVARSLTDLTPGTTVPEIRGVIGASEDGDYVYFVAEGLLSGEEENDAGQKAEEGANNLYLWHEGEGVRFIGGLSDLDEEVWQSVPERTSARLSPDGRHLAFLSIESQALSGYDNRIAAGEHCHPIDENAFDGDPRCAQAYLYGAEADELTCASCNLSGARPAGPTEWPGWSNPYEGPRYLSEDGSRLFFESRDVLNAADQNGRRDVYEFERQGAGSCDSESPAFDQASGGCHFLISSGKSSDETYLLDASSDGRDAFLSTRQPLSGWDQNDNYDVYDARIDGGFPEPPPIPAICAGEACKPPSTAAPSAGPSPATPHFQGPGNASKGGSPRCAKGKVRRRGRCVKHQGNGKPRHRRRHHKANGNGSPAR